MTSVMSFPTSLSLKPGLSPSELAAICSIPFSSYPHYSSRMATWSWDKAVASIDRDSYAGQNQQADRPNLHDPSEEDDGNAPQRSISSHARLKAAHDSQFANEPPVHSIRSTDQSRPQSIFRAAPCTEPDPVRAGRYRPLPGSPPKSPPQAPRAVSSPLPPSIIRPPVRQARTNDSEKRKIFSNAAPGGTTTSLASTSSDAAHFEPYGTLKSRAVINSDMLDNLLSFGDRREACSETGYIYVFGHPRHAGFIKIGYTSGKINTRVRQQLSTCKVDFQLVPDVANRKLPFTKIIDDVLKEEFHNQRYRLKCTACKRCARSSLGTHDGTDGTVEDVDQARAREHCEWYMLEPEVALRAIERWRRWLEDCKPFNERGRPSLYWKQALSQGQTRPSAIDWDELLTGPTILDSIFATLNRIVKALECAFSHGCLVFEQMFESLGGRRKGGKFSKSSRAASLGLLLILTACMFACGIPVLAYYGKFGGSLALVLLVILSHTALSSCFR